MHYFHLFVVFVFHAMHESINYGIMSYLSNFLYIAEHNIVILALYVIKCVNSAFYIRIYVESKVK